MGKTTGRIIWGCGGYQELSFGHVNFKMPVRHPGRDIMSAIEYINLEFKSEM